MPGDADSGGLLALSESELAWANGSAAPRTVEVYADSPWRVARAPWWLAAGREGGALVLRPRLAGPFVGAVTIESEGGEAAVAVTAPEAGAASAPILLKGFLGVALGTGAMLLLGPWLPASASATTPDASLFARVALRGLLCGAAAGYLVGGARFAWRSAIGLAVGFLALIPMFFLAVSVSFGLMPTVVGEANALRQTVRTLFVAGSSFAALSAAWAGGMFGMAAIGGGAWRGALGGIAGAGLVMGLARLQARFPDLPLSWDQDFIAYPLAVTALFLLGRLGQPKEG